MKILHFALENYARVPANLVKAERRLGHESYLMTLYRTFQRFDEEDFCLNMPFVATDYLKFWKKIAASKKSNLTNLRKDASSGTPVWGPENWFEDLLFRVRDRLWESRIRKSLTSIQIDSFDIIFLDGGAGFLRSGKIARELKSQGKKIVICYYGSDLRTRGIIPAVDELTEYRFTFEFDHTLLDASLKFMLFPFEMPVFEKPVLNASDTVRIGHAPTNRAAKGTEAILRELGTLTKNYPVEIVLIENLPYREALKLKASCDIFVDTIGELGYGVNSLEALALGIPTAVEILPDFEAVLGEHPFINISQGTIADRIVPFIASKKMRKEWGERGASWVSEYHDPVKVASRIHSAIPANSRETLTA